MSNYFSINNTVFTVLGYPLSYVELFGTIFYLWSVWLIAKGRILTWPVGIMAVLLYMILFYQVRLYSDVLEQVYYLIASIYGWWYWVHSPMEKGTILSVKYSSPSYILAWLLISILFGVALGAFMSRAHTFFPSIFPEEASYPYLDALTTILSFTAMWLMARQRIESWLYWIVIDVVGIGLYYVKAVKFISMLYVILLLMAIKGFVSWVKITRTTYETAASS